MTCWCSTHFQSNGPTFLQWPVEVGHLRELVMDLLQKEIESICLEGVAREVVLMFTALFQHRRAMLMTLIFAFAGGGNLNDLFMFNPKTFTWADFSAQEIRPAKRKLHGFAPAGGKLYVHGGSGVCLGDNGIYIDA
jgi:hypothetical protein